MATTNAIMRNGMGIAGVKNDLATEPSVGVDAPTRDN